MFKTRAGRISSVYSADFEDSALLSLRMYKSVIFSRRFERTFRLHLQALIPRKAAFVNLRAKKLLISRRKQIN
jgi:hypothetical protein